MFSQNYNNHDNTIPISKKSQKSEIQNIDKILKFFNHEHDNIYKNDPFINERIFNSIENIKENRMKKLEKFMLLMVRAASDYGKQ